MAELPCPYCGSVAILKDSSIIYGRSYGLAFVCENYPACDAYVGVHKHNNEPLGRLANAELRIAKIDAHKYFDNLWQRKLIKRRKERGNNYKKHWARGSGYKWLAEQMGLESKDCHIGMFDVQQCKKVVEICKPYYKISI